MSEIGSCSWWNGNETVIDILKFSLLLLIEIEFGYVKYMIIVARCLKDYRKEY